MDTVHVTYTIIESREEMPEEALMPRAMALGATGHASDNEAPWFDEIVRLAGLDPEQLAFRVQETRPQAGQPAEVRFMAEEVHPVEQTITFIEMDVDESTSEVVARNWREFAVDKHFERTEAGRARTETFELPQGIRKVYLSFFGVVRSVFQNFEPRLCLIDPPQTPGEDPQDTPWDEVPEKTRNARIQHKPVALIVHGFASKSEMNFEALKKELLERGDYGAVIGYSYPSTRQAIAASGDQLFDTLAQQGILQPDSQIDVYAHSEGGLVVRSMFKTKGDKIGSKVRHIVMAATPHLGTPIAAWGNTVVDTANDVMECAAQLVSSALSGGKGLAAAILHMLLYAFLTDNAKDPGLENMIPQPDNAFLREINQTPLRPNGKVYITSGSMDLEASCWIMEKLYGLIFKKEPHDGVVPLASGLGLKDPDARHIHLDQPVGWHSSYYKESNWAKLIVDTVFSS